jgi:tripartite-type tricarboxylate transporter receptor subunit TctC
MRTTLGAVVLVLGLAGGGALADDYPSKPIKFVCPFPAGGVSDTVARVVAQKLSANLGQQVVVDNRSGAAGMLGVEVVAHSAPDGYTLLATTADFITVNPAAYAKLTYDPKQFVPIAMTAKSPSVIVVNAKAGIDSIKDLVAKAKARPGEIAYASPGAGTTNHLAVELLSEKLGIKLLHVPYRGGAPAATAAASGEAPLGVIAIPTGQAYVQSGAVKVLGITTAQRASFAPDWPTIAEGGVPGYDLALWMVVFAPAGTPQPIITKMHDEVNKVLRDPEVATRFASLGAEPAPMSIEAFESQMKRDTETLGKIIRDAGIHIE